MPVFLTLAVLFILVPVTEILLLIRIGAAFGPGATVALVLVTGFAGAALAKWQGAKAWHAVRVAMRRGEMPSKELFDGFCILCAGLLMVTPGLLTDGAGFLLLIPPFRASVRKALAKALLGQVVSANQSFSFSAGRAGEEPTGHPGDDPQSDIIDVEAERVDD
ncbi:MAG: FxsA family protein [Lentisphaeria bacterium]|nr:FxsA family protein [Lentisphaeria bacterium]